MHATYLRHALTTTCTRVDVPLKMSFLRSNLFARFADTIAGTLAAPSLAFNDEAAECGWGTAIYEPQLLEDRGR